MTIKSSGNQLSFSEIESEFGNNPGRSLGRYRSTHPDFTNESPSGSSLSNLPLDTGIPLSGQIKFSNFYSKKLNMVVDYYGDTTNLNKWIGFCPKISIEEGLHEFANWFKSYYL